QDFLNLQYSNGLDFLRSSCKNYLIKSINITIPGAAKVIGCNRGNPYILKHSILTEALCFARKNKPARFSDTSQIARAFVLATFIGDRGSNRPLIEYCKTGNLVEVNRADKGDDHRYSVVSHKLFTPSTINYLKEVTSSEDRLRNLLFTNAFRHFGAYLILNFLKFKDEEERALYLELYLNDIATQTNNSKVKLNLQNHSKILSDKFANYIIEEVHNVYAA
ncbi:MAG: hypothetical protein NE330_22455, partial [Lentisphaeraceae bacterium]|nr:hypothetical protein [Lentisphaeraceae bacterium]